MKKFYESPEVEIEKFTINNIIVTSGLEEGGDDIELFGEF